MNLQQMVKDFHLATGHPVSKKPRTLAIGYNDFRLDLIREEIVELMQALSDTELASTHGSTDDMERAVAVTAKEMADVLYVIFGTAVAMGVNLEAVFEEVHRSNMSKLGPNGKPELREDGKILKGKYYIAPDIRRVLYGTGAVGKTDSPSS